MKIIYIYSTNKGILTERIGYLDDGPRNVFGAGVLAARDENGKYICQVYSEPGLLRGNILWYLEPNEQLARREFIKHELMKIKECEENINRHRDIIKNLEDGLV